MIFFTKYPPTPIFIIAKNQKIFIITITFGVSSNGRTRDFGSLYHGSNPCAPTKNQTGLVPVLFLVRDHGTTPATQLPVRQQVDLISRAQSNRYGCPAGVAHLCVIPRELSAPQPPFASATLRAASPICFLWINCFYNPYVI